MRLSREGERRPSASTRMTRSRPEQLQRGWNTFEGPAEVGKFGTVRIVTKKTGACDDCRSIRKPT
jgi:hypothetical protein